MKESTMDQTVRVKLTTEQLAAYSDSMSVKVLTIEALREKKKRDAAQTQQEIDDLRDELQEIAKTVQQGEEQKAQRELFVSQGEAAAALTEVAKRVCSPVEALSCDVHGACSCPQEVEAPGPLMCAYCTKVPATCMGDGGEDQIAPACDTCCAHDGGGEEKCRPLTPEDQPKPDLPTTAPEVKEIGCPLHGVDSQHAKTPAEAAPAPAGDDGSVPPVPATPEEAHDVAIEKLGAPVSPTAEADVAEVFGAAEAPVEGSGA